MSTNPQTPDDASKTKPRYVDFNDVSVTVIRHRDPNHIEVRIAHKPTRSEGSEPTPQSNAPTGKNGR